MNVRIRSYTREITLQIYWQVKAQSSCILTVTLMKSTLILLPGGYLLVLTPGKLDRVRFLLLRWFLEAVGIIENVALLPNTRLKIRLNRKREEKKRKEFLKKSRPESLSQQLLHFLSSNYAKTNSQHQQLFQFSLIRSTSAAQWPDMLFNLVFTETIFIILYFLNPHVFHVFMTYVSFFLFGQFARCASWPGKQYQV